MKSRWVVMGVLCLAVCPSVSWAQVTDPAAIATRRALLDQATAAHAHGDHAGALQAALSAARIEPSASVALFIAEEHQTLGHVAQAFVSAQRCTTMAENNTGIQNREAILIRCRELTDTLRGRIGLLALQLSSPLPAGLRVHINTEEVDTTQTEPFAVEPGIVGVDVVAGDVTRNHQEIQVAAGQLATLEVVIPAAAPSSPPPPRQSTAPGTHHVLPGPGPYIVAAVGAVGLILAIPFFAAREGALGDCTNDPTSSTLVCHQSSYDSANTFNTAANVAGIGGAIVLAGGVSWWLISYFASSEPNAEHARRTIIPSVAVLPGGGGMMMLGGSL